MNVGDLPVVRLVGVFVLVEDVGRKSVVAIEYSGGPTEPKSGGARFGWTELR